MRALTPTSYRVVHLLLHSCLLASTSVSGITEQQLAQLILNPPGGVVLFCEAHITSDWRNLMKMLNCNGEVLCALLHKLVSVLPSSVTALPFGLDTEGKRNDWENRFATATLSPLCKNVQNVVNDYIAKSKSTNVEVSLLEAEIEEVDVVPATNNNSSDALALRQLLHVTAPNTFESFRAQCIISLIDDYSCRYE